MNYKLALARTRPANSGRSRPSRTFRPENGSFAFWPGMPKRDFANDPEEGQRFPFGSINGSSLIGATKWWITLVPARRNRKLFVRCAEGADEYSVHSKGELYSAPVYEQRSRAGEFAYQIAAYYQRVVASSPALARWGCGTFLRHDGFKGSTSERSIRSTRSLQSVLYAYRSRIRVTHTSHASVSLVPSISDEDEVETDGDRHRVPRVRNGSSRCI